MGCFQKIFLIWVFGNGSSNMFSILPEKLKHKQNENDTKQALNYASILVYSGLLAAKNRYNRLVSLVCGVMKILLT